MNPNLNGTQFEQLKMFMTPDEVVDSTEKLDTSWRTKRLSPREQWEHPRSGGDDYSLKDRKINQAYDKSWADRPYETMPPLHLVHGVYDDEGPAGARYKRPMLMDGHHRLALAQDRGHPYVAVLHHNNEDEWDEYGYDASHWKS